MDDGLVLGAFKTISLSIGVLILIVVDDGLVRMNDMIDGDFDFGS